MEERKVGNISGLLSEFEVENWKDRNLKHVESQLQELSATWFRNSQHLLREFEKLQREFY